MTAANGPKVSEAAFQAQVLHLAALKGWRTAHFRTAMDSRGRHRTPVAGDGKGFPDLVLARVDGWRNGQPPATEPFDPNTIAGGRVIFAELKSDRGRFEPGQRDWLTALQQAGAEVYVWRPADWDEIVEVLT